MYRCGKMWAGTFAFGSDVAGCRCESVSKRRRKALGWPLMTVSWEIITSFAFLPQARIADHDPFCGCMWPTGKLCRCPLWFVHHSALFIQPQCRILHVKKDLFHITELPFSQGYLCGIQHSMAESKQQSSYCFQKSLHGGGAVKEPLPLPLPPASSLFQLDFNHG